MKSTNARIRATKKAMSKANLARIRQKNKVASHVRFIYGYNGNKRLTPDETVEALKKYFGIRPHRYLSMERIKKIIYGVRAYERKLGRMTPHDRTARLTPPAHLDVLATIVGQNKRKAA